MNRIKEFFKRNKLTTVIRIIYELFNEFKVLYNYSGAISKRKSSNKWEAELIMKAHAIEKGMSMHNVRIGFGEAKVHHILDEMNEYFKQYNNISFIGKIKALLDAYFYFNEQNGHINTKLKEKFIKTFENELPRYNGGIYTINKKDVMNAIDFNFDDFLKSRYAIRDFDTTAVDIDSIYKAIEMAKKTPSACNRQPWGVYIYKNNKKNEILQWQGNKGFTENIQIAIIVTASLESYFINEIHQAYIDGGLYAMTLIYCLHSLGLGTIPLTLGMMSSKNKALYKKFNISKGEVPILMIGVGNLKETYKAAVSERKSIDEYIKVIE